MKLSSFISHSHQTFASVFVAFSLFGFLFPHHATQVRQNHQVQLRTAEQTSQTQADDSDPGYEWFY